MSTLQDFHHAAWALMIFMSAFKSTDWYICSMLVKWSSVDIKSPDGLGGTGLPSQCLSASSNGVRGFVLYIMWNEVYLAEECLATHTENKIPSGNSS